MLPEKSEVRTNSKRFVAMCEAILGEGHSVRMHARGLSMMPNINDGDFVEILPAANGKYCGGDIVLAKTPDGLKLHRVTEAFACGGITRGDAGLQNDLPSSDFLGRAIVIEHHGSRTAAAGAVARAAHFGRRILRRVTIGAAQRIKSGKGVFLLLAGLGFVAGTTVFSAPASAQSADLGLTMSVNPSVAAAGSTLTYTETVTNGGPNAATTATLSQQTPPNTTFNSITPPAGWTCTTPGAGNTGQIQCTDGANFASPGNAVFTLVLNVVAGTAAGTQIQQSANVTSLTSDPDASNNAALATTLIEVAGQADMGVSVTASPSPVFVSSALTYSITIQNFGLANSTTSTLTDTLPGTVTYVSATPSQGTCSQAAGVVTCNLGTINASSSATVSIVVTTPGTASTISNTAAIATSLTDPVASNNSVTTSTTVQPLACSTPAKNGAGGTLTGIVNTYYPPNNATTNLAVGATSVALGASSGANTGIAIGDRLLIIEMQDADLTTLNTGNYGDNVAGDPATGVTGYRDVGLFEFVTATNAIGTGGGTLNFVGAGAGGGLVNAYENINYANGGTGHGQRRFQVIRVPQYSTATLSSTLTALAWTGSVGGVLAIDVAGQLTLGGVVSVDGLGFRGGAGRSLAGANGTVNTDYRTSAGTATNGSKGEGIAGAPRYTVNLTFDTVANSGVEGYLNGSYARGAAGNAGGGGTDGNPTANDQNTGGGGGGNGGTGGKGGYSWNTSSNSGGFGGAAFPATPNFIVMGGGGGAGTTNNGTADPANTNPAGINSSGAAGGGIVIIHAGSVTGTGSITANGQSAIDVQNDGAGGGGAGGSIILLSGSGDLNGLTVTANGGAGGRTWLAQAPGAYPGNRHGPGGGGGGGAIFLSFPPANLSVSGGANGQTTTALDAFGSTSGSDGIFLTNVTAPLPGAQSGGACSTADLSVTNSGTPPVVSQGGNITYTQVVTNNGPQSAVNAIFTEAVPANTTFQSLSVPAGWTCVTPAVGGTGNISCTSASIANAASSTFTLIAQVILGIPNGTQITDTASVVSGTVDPLLSNNSASVTTIVGSAATSDLTITNTGSPNPVTAGQNVTFTQQVANLGPAAATSVNLTETVPTNTTFVSLATPAGWTCITPAVGGTGTITCSISTLAAGGSATFQPVFKVAAGTAAGTVISNTDLITQQFNESNPTDNTATATVVVAGATQTDLSVTTSASPNPVLAGNNITFAETVSNNGPLAAATDTFRVAVPANTTFVSIGSPAGWTCVTPAVGGTGNITCTATTMAANTTASFPLVVKVTAGTAPGTVISNSASISSVTGDPVAANNSASSSNVVASPTQADVSIVKTATPEPVNQNTNLVYTLTITNNGPADALNVTVSDPLPSQVSFTSVATTQGTCSQSAGTVSCSLGTMNAGALAIVTINVNAATFSTAATASNTATVSSSTGDPNLTNNSSTVISTIQAPTAVQLVSFEATPQADGTTLLEWKTREEVRNLGFNVYREDATGRHKLNSSLIAGSALVIRGGRPQHAAKSYQLVDTAPNQGSASYWLEDVDLNGTKNQHGPAQSGFGIAAKKTNNAAAAPLLVHLNEARSSMLSASGASSLQSEFTPNFDAQLSRMPRSSIEGLPAVKISVQHEGWYRVTQPQLVAAGLDPRANARTLQLFAEGIEQPILVNGSREGSLGPNDSIEFYGTGVDTPFTDTRAYLLVSGHGSGKRIELSPASRSGQDLTSFAAVSVLQERTTYFAALLNGEDQDNFFGAIITSEPVDQTLQLNHVATSGSAATLEVTLQGVTEDQPHSVSVNLNGIYIGSLSFSGQANYKTTFDLNPGALVEGTNVVTLTAQDGDNDVSLVQNITVRYPREFVADSNVLRMNVPSGGHISASGFTNAQVRVFDISNPLAVEQVPAKISLSSQGTVADFVVPGTSSSGVIHTLLALTIDQITAPQSIAFRPPTTLLERQDGADVLIISHPDFVQTLQPLVQLRQRQGHRVKVVSVDEIYDAFHYSERTPYAVRDFLKQAMTQWRTKPQSILLVGDASLDPRNYLGFGYFDFVPTRLIDTAAMKTASDDWFTDFNETGFGSIPIGRLPVRTAADATLVISKIVGYENGYATGDWLSQGLVVADNNVGADFSTPANTVAGTLQNSLNITKILSNDLAQSAAKQQIVDSINHGQLLVNYLGHGSVEQWSFTDLMDNQDATSLQNGNRLPVFFIMNCLNGFFQDVYTQSLAESLLLAPNGGGVAVWASAGFTDAGPQATMDQSLIRLLAAQPNTPLGLAILQAKSQTSDKDVRRTWILFGDPAMQLHWNKSAVTKPAVAAPRSVPTPNKPRLLQKVKE